MISQHTKDSVMSVRWKDQDGDPKDLTGVSSVKGVLRTGNEPNETDTTIVGAIAVTDDSGGLLEWTIDEADADTPGIFGLFFFATFASGEVLPSLRYELQIAPAPTAPA